MKILYAKLNYMNRLAYSQVLAQILTFNENNYKIMLLRMF